MKSFLVAFLIVLVFFSAELKIGNGFEIPVVPEPTGKWCGYSVPMKPCTNDECIKQCIAENTHGWLMTTGKCTSIPSLKDCYCIHQCP
ncbi:unnamed protein product [Arabidopsis lyrata]|uniref:Predicted protein n=1 Tax=Arabidopsis lyrata subsp. lyrata TaxID=81972 RepID=D7L300_ARALL|nr:putative defensin-like protein 317 [Arabidopsis lyrata subsp. lyrata]EFH58639.1 predicted protein [Arabidopsis lyrata subsp. lyrata]CAH8259361.1 unnamed protein product [Arabidopsis lyrata]|eukprot:XP_002882380.1 putative defensin-like protein 317 [Arabidopsis lyrata subsp. lyrata]